MPTSEKSVVEKYDEGQTLELEYMSTHKQTVRYRLAGDAYGLGAALESVYIYKHALPNPEKPPRRVVVGVRFE